MYLDIPHEVLRNRLTYRMDITGLYDLILLHLGVYPAPDIIKRIIQFYISENTLHGYCPVDEYEIAEYLSLHVKEELIDEVFCLILEELDFLFSYTPINSWGLYSVEFEGFDIVHIEYLVDFRILQWNQEHGHEYTSKRTEQMYGDRYTSR